MAAIARIYQASFDRNPAWTLAATNGALSAIGDTCAQSVQLFSNRELDKSHYDFTRTLRFAAFGVAMGPVIGKWNHFLEVKFPLRSLGNLGKVSFPSLAKRVTVDQLVMAPAGLTFFIGGMGAMEGKNRHEISKKYKDMYVPVLLANYKLWPAIQLINFRFMPLAYRVPFTSTCGIFWTIYLSLVNSSDTSSTRDHKH